MLNATDAPALGFDVQLDESHSADLVFRACLSIAEGGQRAPAVTPAPAGNIQQPTSSLAKTQEELGNAVPTHQHRRKAMHVH